MAYLRTVESIGATGRDFATVALWEAALPANLTTGDGQTRIGEMFADANYTEIGTVIGGQTTDENTPIILRAAAGESPIWRPTSGNANFLAITSRNVFIDGIEFTGDGGGLGQHCRLSTDRIHIQRCIFRDGSSNGLVVTNGPHYVLYCLSYDNVLNGVLKVGVVGSLMHNCGIFNNGGDGVDASGSGVNTWILRNNWIFDNTGADVAKFRDELYAGWNVISDTSFTDGGATNMKNNLESQASSGAGFVNLAGRDFRLAAGSLLRARGVAFTAHRTATAQGISEGRPSHERWLDLDRLPMLNAKSTDLVDVGPYQSSYV